MPVAGGIPNIQTLEHIDLVLERLAAWRGRRRVRVLEVCARRLSILRQANMIDAETLKQYRRKVLPKLGKARRQVQVIKPLPREEAVAHASHKQECEEMAEQNLNGPHREIYVALYKAAVHASQRTC